MARGLHYNWHRFYDPEVGRYISVDPLGLDAGLNVFGYAFGNPTTYVDPDGQIPTALKLLVTAIAGLAVYIFSSKGCGTNKDGKNKDGKNMVDKAIDKTKESKNLVNEKYEKLIKSTCLGRNDTDEAKINCLASNGMCNLLKYKYKQLQAKERNSQLYSDERLEGLLVSCGRAEKKFKPISPWERLKRW